MQQPVLAAHQMDELYGCNSELPMCYLSCSGTERRALTWQRAGRPPAHGPAPGW